MRAAAAGFNTLGERENRAPRRPGTSRAVAQLWRAGTCRPEPTPTTGLPPYPGIRTGGLARGRTGAAIRPTASRGKKRKQASRTQSCTKCPQSSAEEGRIRASPHASQAPRTLARSANGLYFVKLCVHSVQLCDRLTFFAPARNKQRAEDELVRRAACDDPQIATNSPRAVPPLPRDTHGQRGDAVDEVRVDPLRLAHQLDHREALHDLLPQNY